LYKISHHSTECRLQNEYDDYSFQQHPSALILQENVIATIDAGKQQNIQNDLIRSKNFQYYLSKPNETGIRY